MATIMSPMGKLERVSTLKTCIMGRMANFHGLMLVSELALELA